MQNNVDYQARIDKVLARVDADVVAIVPGANMLYFTGLHYHLSERPTIAFFSAEGVSFIVPELEVTKLQTQDAFEARAFSWSDTDGYTAAFQEAIAAMGLNADKTLAVDGQTMRVFEMLALGDAGVQTGAIADAGDDLLGIRSIKTTDEIEAMRKAVQLSETALTETLKQVRAGMTEREIAAILTEQLGLAGSRGHAFSPLVLTGARSALPHGFTADYEVKEGDFLLFDFGGSWLNYPADITRTFVMGTASDEMNKIYQAVHDANQASREISKPGVTCGAVDKAARDVIEAAGYGEYFTHRTGHGLGLSGHEAPQIAANVETLLEPGMVYTIEPGIYVPGLGGVRIEDDVAVTDTGIDVLTTFPRELRSLS
ncbi:MAG: M24 family metallopeptidase [Aggregatilineales bacterium]